MNAMRSAWLKRFGMFCKVRQRQLRRTRSLNERTLIINVVLMSNPASTYQLPLLARRLCKPNSPCSILPKSRTFATGICSSRKIPHCVPACERASPVEGEGEFLGGVQACYDPTVSARSLVQNEEKKAHRRSLVDLRRLLELAALRTRNVALRPRIERVPNRPKRHRTPLHLRAPPRRPVDSLLGLDDLLDDLRHPRTRDARLKAAPQPAPSHRLPIHHLGRKLGLPFVPVLDDEGRGIDEAERADVAEGVEEGGRGESGALEGQNEDGFGGGKERVGLGGVELHVGG